MWCCYTVKKYQTNCSFRLFEREALFRGRLYTVYCYTVGRGRRCLLLLLHWSKWFTSNICVLTGGWQLYCKVFYWCGSWEIVFYADWGITILCSDHTAQKHQVCVMLHRKREKCFVFLPHCYKYFVVAHSTSHYFWKCSSMCAPVLFYKRNKLAYSPTQGSDWAGQ